MERKSQLYWANVEFILKKTHPEYKDVKHGLVYAFVKSLDAEEAMVKIKKEFVNHEFKATGFRYIMPFGIYEWESKEWEAHYEKLIQKASKKNKAVLDEYYELTDWNDKMILPIKEDER